MDRRIQSLSKLFNIRRPEDWNSVLPDSVMAKPKVGQKAIDHLRLWLADQGLTLRDDRTPDYWQKMLATSRNMGKGSKNNYRNRRARGQCATCKQQSETFRCNECRTKFNAKLREWRFQRSIAEIQNHRTVGV